MAEAQGCEQLAKVIMKQSIESETNDFSTDDLPLCHHINLMFSTKGQLHRRYLQVKYHLTVSRP